ncbi:MAG: D-alanyl-D-alanine carboxypeptidase [Oscillospiraceae bacterium]|nr:D-alanyl-D-alanine carboxypeptidase [Oscillospiraceae bacterium]
MKRVFALAVCCLLIYMNIVPVYRAKKEWDGNVVCETAVVIDGKTGQVLYEKDAHRVMYPASTTKILTGLLAVEHGNLSDEITYSHEAVYSIERGSSHASISEGEVLTLEQSMYAISIESANDAAAGIGEYLEQKTGTPLAQLMTERAKAAGAKNSNFVNPHGLPDNNHYTTAYDLAMIAKECIKHEDFKKIFTAKTYSIPPTNKQSQTRTFNAANWFVNGVIIYDGNFTRDDLLMTKTGWTQEARHTLVTAIERDGKTLICVVMYAYRDDDTFGDTENLLNWALENYKSVDLTGEYIALCADEEINCDDRGRLFIEKENITAQGASVLIPNSTDVKDIRADFSQPTLNGDMTTATMTATLYTGEGDGRKILAAVPVTASVSERTVVSVMPHVETSLASDLLMAVIFGMLTFVAVMICDILIGKRI